MTRRKHFGVGIRLLAFLIGAPWLASIGDAKPLPGATNVGAEMCNACHGDLAAKFGETKMGKIFVRAPRDELEKLACENCHGPGSKHVEDPTTPGSILKFGSSSQTSVEDQNASCLQCHEKGKQTHWVGSVHQSRGLACVTCHKVMEKTSDRFQLIRTGEKTPFSARRAETEVCLQCHLQRKAQMLRSSHMPLREGKMTCGDCHNPHGTATPGLLVENSVNATCYKCHANKRGPLLWEHPPVRESCLNCHDAHGSIHPAMLKEKPPRLCQQCHIENRHPTEPHAANERFVFNRSCMNCHPHAHGSNHPSGPVLQR